MTRTSELTRAQTRTRAQRERILTAAQACFVKSGFHNASMAAIAETASMSPGLIYRYFENKNAIILAIIEGQLELARGKIRQMRAADDLVAGLLEYFDAHDCDPEKSMSAALFLDMSAEASRDPEIAEAIRSFDQTVRSELADWLSRSEGAGGHALPVDVARERALGLILLIEGLKVRKSREPGVDRALLKSALEMMLAPVVNQSGS